MYYCGVLFQVRELGNPKAKKTKDTPAHSEVCEPCKQYLDNGEEVPLPLLARLLKFKFLAVKSNDLKRKDADKKVSQIKLFTKSIFERLAILILPTYVLNNLLQINVNVQIEFQ